jgi:hypothetical protein
MVWQARPNVDWLSVSPTSGAGEGSVTYQVAPYNEVATRQGTLTVAGNTFTVFQYGRRMKLDSYSVTKDYETHVIPITVNALAITQWSVTPNNSWISVVDAGNGHGGAEVLDGDAIQALPGIHAHELPANSFACVHLPGSFRIGRSRIHPLLTPSC